MGIASVFTVTYRELPTLRALAAVLAARPEYRARLAEPERVSRLARELTQGVLPPPAVREGARRDTIDILLAIRQAGLVRPVRRPLPSDPVPAPDGVLAAVREHLDANPYRKGRHVDDDTVMRVVRSVYLDVEPWPFAALVD